MLELEHAELRERRAERELLAVAAVDPGHERLDERLVRLATEPARDERRDRLVLVAGAGRDVRLRGEARLALGREQLAPSSASRSVGIIPVRPSGSGCSSSPRRTNVRWCSGRRRDELVSETELLDEPDTALLPREEAVRAPPRSRTRRRARSGASRRARRRARRAPRRASGATDSSRRAAASPAMPPADDDDPHAACAPASHGSARARTSSASAAMKTGSSFSAGGRSSRMPEAGRDLGRAVVDVEEDLDVVGDEADRDRDDVAHASRGERREVLAEVRARPTARACGPRTGTPTTSARPASPARSATSRAVSRHCSPYGSPDASTRCGRLCALKTTWTRSRSSSGQRESPSRTRDGERVDEARRVVVARDVLEVDPAALEVEPVRDLLLVARDRQRAEVRREHEAHGVRHAVVDHLADDVLDPRRPVPHPEVAAVLVAELAPRARRPGAA